VARDPLDHPGNRGLTSFLDGSEVSIEDLPQYTEFFEILREIQDPVALLMMCEEQDESEGRTPGTTLAMFRLEICMATTRR
jgi:hypothetical protein